MHGVSGTPPDQLLYTSSITYDQGWDLAKVYERNRDNWDVKAYHWGSLTSKSSLTAFWILLAPFAMANVAGWMSEAPNIWSRIWVRVGGLALTGIFFAQVANMAFDIPLSAGTAATTAVWLLTGAALLLVLGLGLLSTQTTFKPLTIPQRLRIMFQPTVEAMSPALTDADWTDPAGQVELVGVDMWSVKSILHRLRRLHLTFGMAVLSIVAARAVDSATVELVAVVLGGVSLVVLAFSTGPTATNRVLLWVTAVTPLLGSALLVWALITAATGPIVASTLNVSDDMTFELALILGIAAGLGLVGEMIRGGVRRGWVPMGLLAVAALIGGTLGLTGAMLVETYLTESSTTGETFAGGSAFVTVAMFGLVVTMLVTFLLASLFRRVDTDESRVRRGILRARYVLAAAGVYGAVAGVAAVWLACRGGSGCTQANIMMPRWVTEDPENLTVFLGLPFDPMSLLGWAKILMVAVPAILITRSIVGGLLNGQDSRRQVGILWDLGSFWPRWFHPLGPPAYGPYAVNRLQTILSESKPDVLTAHSQGSLVSAVAICLADEDQAPGLLITYGSQIGELYPSLFPTVGFDRLVQRLDEQMDGRWINLWRGNDAVGGQPVGDLGDRNWVVTTGRGHSRYELTQEFCAARKAGLSGDLRRPNNETLAGCWDHP